MLRLLVYAALRLHGVSPIPPRAWRGVACDEELPESGSWLYKLIHNDNLKRLTLLMMRL